jgi:acyl-homoserine-lactone acylase
MARLPQLVNPAAGYLQNTNDPPWLTVLEQPIAPDAFRDVTAGQGLSLRGQHALQAVHAKPTFTLADLLAVKNDGHWPLADRLKADLIEAIRSTTPAESAAAVELLRAWDNSGSLKSSGSVLFWRWWGLYQKAAKPVYREPWSATAPLETPRGIGDQGAAVQAFRAAVEALQKELGTIAPTWGEVYRFRRGALDYPVAGASGQTGTLRVLYFKQDPDQRSSAVAGESYALGVEFQDVPVAFSVLPYSESSRPSSAHYNDQASLFVSGQYKRLWFAEPDIAAHTGRSYVIPESGQSSRAQSAGGDH